MAKVTATAPEGGVQGGCLETSYKLTDIGEIELGAQAPPKSQF